MSRLEKKCLLASTGLHSFLLMLLLFGSAFFVVKEKPSAQPKLQFYPSKLIEAALAGGGGNPNVARTDDVQKGSPSAAAPLLPPPPQRVEPKPQPQQPPPPPPKPEVRKVEPPKPEPTTTAKTSPPKPADKLTPTKPRIDLADLKPITRADSDKAKAKAKAEAKAEAEAEAKEAARKETLARQRLAQQIGKAAETMQRGFSSGTKVDVGGPGGAAYANYAAVVQAAYEDAWKILPDLNDDDAVAVVRVTIARQGQVVESQIIRRSGNAVVDRSVQRALDKVKLDGLPPFPDFIKDSERSFTIEFNLKTKRLIG